MKTKCVMCDKMREMSNNGRYNSGYDVCTRCYPSIPRHVPISQDRQYIKLWIKKNEEN